MNNRYQILRTAGLFASLILVVILLLVFSQTTTKTWAEGSPALHPIEFREAHDVTPPSELLQLGAPHGGEMPGPVKWKSGAVYLDGGLDGVLATLSAQLDAGNGGETAVTYVVLQYRPGVTLSERESLQSWGVAELEYVPEKAYLARVPVGVLDLLAERPFVHAVAPMRPEWKLAPDLAAMMDESPEATFPVRVLAFAPLPERENGRLTRLAESLVYEGELTRSEVLDLLQESLVKWIEPIYEMRTSMATSNHVIAVDNVWAQGLDGSGVQVGVIDSGIEDSHDHFNGVGIQFARDWVADGRNGRDCLGHGTHVAGTIAGGGVFNGQTVSGIASGATLIVERTLDCNDNWHAGTYAQIYDEVANRGADIINNSWGMDSNENYNSAARDTDIWALAHPNVVLLFANGNGCDPYNVNCTDDGHSPALAKNVIAVGGTEDGSPLTPNGGRPTAETADNVDLISDLNDVDLPEDDRVKPDVNAPGEWITSAVMGNGYDTWRGTSMATPHVAGVLALFLDAYPGARADVIKANLINTNVSLGGKFGQTGYRRGWGRISIMDFIYRLDGESVSATFTGAVSEGTTLQCGNFTVNSGVDQIKATMAYWDPAGSTASSQALVNNVDLYLHSPSDTWWSNTSTVDNVEKVTLNDPEFGSWQACAYLPEGLNQGSSQSYAIAVSVVDEAPTRTRTVPNSVTVNQGEVFTINANVSIADWIAYGSYATAHSRHSDIQLQSGSSTGVVWGDLFPGEARTFQPQFVATACGSFPDAIEIRIGATNFTVGVSYVDVTVNCADEETYIYLPGVMKAYDASIIYADRFGDSGSGWYAGETDSYKTAYLNGEYLVKEKDDHGAVLSQAPFTCHNCRLDVDARFASVSYHGYGLFFAGVGNDWYTYIARLDTGKCDLVKHTSSGWTLLASKNCNLQTTENHLAVEWQAPAIRAYLNDQLVHSIMDSSFSGEGDIGVLTYWEGDARFDDFVVRSLP